MLGFGREGVQVFSADGTGRLDPDALEAELRSLDGAPAIVIGNAGEVNAGHFDPIDDAGRPGRTPRRLAARRRRLRAVRPRHRRAATP